MKKPLPRCLHRCADGSQCSRRVSDGSEPPICHLHASIMNTGQSVSPIIGSHAAAEVDEEKLYRKLMNDKDSAVRLRALNAYVEWKRAKTGCPTCVSREAREGSTTAFLAALTDEESAWLDTVLDTFNALRDAVYGRQPDLRPDGDSVRSLVNDHGVEVVGLNPPIASPHADETIRENEQQRTTSAPCTVPREQYADAGLFVLNGAITHSLGDDYAQAVLSGEISFEDAREQQRRARHTADLLGASHPDSR